MSLRSLFQVSAWLKRRPLRYLRSSTPLNQYRRVLIFGFSAIFGLISVLSFPVYSMPPADTTVEVSPFSNGSSLLKQGIDRYESEQFSEAVTLWQQALAILENQEDKLNQSFTWSNLSLAYQQLGRWSEAEAAIATSLSLLQPEDTGKQQFLAKALNAQGRLQWSRGQLEDALETWRRADDAYAQANDTAGRVIALINQTRVLQALGFSVQAETQLRQVEQLLQQQTNPQLKAVGLQSLGISLRRVGKLKDSLQVLQESLAIAQATHLSTVTSSILVELGNTERALGSKAITIGKTAEVEVQYEAALRHYQQATAIALSPTLKLPSQINQLSLLVDTGQSSAATALVPEIEPALRLVPPSRAAIYAHLNFVKSLAKLEPAGQSVSPSLAAWLTTAVEQSRLLNDPIAESYALGQLGELYERSQQWADAQNLTRQAWSKAENAQTADVRYRWEWQIGRLLEQQGDSVGAIAAYKAAVESLQSIRNDLVSVSSDVQFSFRDDVEPVYRGLVKLLLSQADGAKPSQADLQMAIQQIDALQLAELENFLGCDIAQTVEINQVEVDATAAKIYPMLLGDRLSVVLEVPNQPLEYHEMIKPRQEIQATLHQLRQDLSEPDRTPEAIAGLQEVYQWLITPFKPTLEQQSQIQTLVFVLDGELRNIPMAALYDDQQFLISKYAVALAPRLSLFKPSARSPSLKVFLGGVGEPQTLGQRSFPKIENLSPELDGIQKLVKADPPLLNAAFTTTNLERQLQVNPFSVIHLKTHGVFSSDPEETFIVAYQALITGKDLGHLLQIDRLGESNPLELLVLSACSTAQGDNRAVLGLAGTAVQAGARSVVSTLWEAEDLPNTQLMLEFYQTLLNPHATRAQALRTAQLALLEKGYQAPHIWATYVLVGNWL